MCKNRPLVQITSWYSVSARSTESQTLVTRASRKGTLQRQRTLYCYWNRRINQTYLELCTCVCSDCSPVDSELQHYCSVLHFLVAAALVTSSYVVC